MMLPISQCCGKTVNKRIVNSESSLHQPLSTTPKIIKMYGISMVIGITTRQAISSGGEQKIMKMILSLIYTASLHLENTKKVG